jgi:hypothetical protein
MRHSSGIRAEEPVMRQNLPCLVYVDELTWILGTIDRSIPRIFPRFSVRPHQLLLVSVCYLRVEPRSYSFDFIHSANSLPATLFPIERTAKNGGKEINVHKRIRNSTDIINFEEGFFCAHRMTRSRLNVYTQYDDDILLFRQMWVNKPCFSRSTYSTGFRYRRWTQTMQQVALSRKIRVNPFSFFLSLLAIECHVLVYIRIGKSHGSCDDVRYKWFPPPLPSPF